MDYENHKRLESYIRKVNLRDFLNEVKAPNIDIVIEEVKHFTEKEAAKRDQIVLGYFGEAGVKRIVHLMVHHLLSPPKLGDDAKILDVGAGSGFFTLKIAEQLHLRAPRTAFYAMDITPAMLRVLTRKTREITPFLGIAENISESIRQAQKYLQVPDKYDAVISTLTLHHCLDIAKVFEGIRDVLENNGKAVIVDLCEHSIEDFRKEMGDVHLGFNPSLVRKLAEKFFSNVYVKKIPGICCECSGRSTKLFVMALRH